MDCPPFPEPPNWVALGYTPEPKPNHTRDSFYADQLIAFPDREYEHAMKEWLHSMPKAIRVAYDEYQREIGRWLDEMDHQLQTIKCTPLSRQ